MIKRRNKMKNKTKILIGLVAALVVLLIAAVCIAMFARPEQPNPTGDTQQQTEQQTEQQTTGGVPVELTVTSPAQTEFLWLEKTVTFTGISDTSATLIINGKEIPRNADGSFSYAVDLKPGMNEITVSHNKTQLQYRIEHRYAVESFYPNKEMSYNSGQTIELEIVARKGSTVKAKLGDKSITMEKKQEQPENINADFELYAGTYKLPSDNAKDKNLGKITFTVTCDGMEEVYTSGDIICLKSASVNNSDPSVTPDYGKYLDVGSGYIVEIIADSAETFNGKTRDDYSDPRNNYLPEGTVDYCLTDIVYDNSGRMKYRLMRCGYRVYTERKNYPYPDGNIKMLPVVNCYKGTLPDHNEIGFVSMEVVGSHTVLTLDSMWKAPFYLDVKPQTYNDPGQRDYKVSSVTAQYVEITFCYATKFTGTVQIPESNPLFKSVELKQNESDCTLRLYFKKTGGYYGWDSYYNDNDQLCFRFVNPTPAQKADNAYGADLTGIRIMLDVGHGGVDGGSAAKTADGKKVEEADINLALAKLLQKELESMGATVIMNRTDDANLTVLQRIAFLKEQAPDLCVAIHHNSYAAQSSVNGCDVMYFGPQGHYAAKAIYDQIKPSGTYRNTYLKWNVYYMARQSVCPFVLVECGYMTNPQDLADAVNPDVNQKKAESMARGIANYFLNQ